MITISDWIHSLNIRGIYALRDQSGSIRISHATQTRRHLASQLLSGSGSGCLRRAISQTPGQISQTPDHSCYPDSQTPRSLMQIILLLAGITLVWLGSKDTAPRQDTHLICMSFCGEQKWSWHLILERLQQSAGIGGYTLMSYPHIHDSRWQQISMKSCELAFGFFPLIQRWISSAKYFAPKNTGWVSG